MTWTSPPAAAAGPSPAARLALFALLAASGAAFAFFAARVWPYTTDDTYITLRYAGNLARGLGLTFNAEPPHAEGYTSILWTLVLAVPHVLGLDAVLFAKVLGLVLATGTAVVLAFGVPGAPRAAARAGGALAAGLFLSFAWAPVHAVSGMETSLAAFLHAATAAVFLRGLEGRPVVPALPLLCLALGLTRPEANLYAVLLLGLAAATAPHGARFAVLRGALLFYVLPGAAYFAARFAYYGLPMPLPFYLKSASADTSGWEPVKKFLQKAVIGAGFPLAVLFAVRGARRPLLLLVPVLAMVGYFVTIEHIMGYGHRYLFPLVPPLALLAGTSLARAGGRRWIAGACVLCSALALARGVKENRLREGEYLAYARGMERVHVPLGHALARVRGQAPPVIALGDVGAVPYFSRLSTIDTFGLNDPAIALGADPARRVLAGRPAMIAFLSARADSFVPLLPGEGPLWEAAARAGYARRVRLEFAPDYHLFVTWRADAPEAAELERVIGGIPGVHRGD